MANYRMLGRLSDPKSVAETILPDESDDKAPRFLWPTAARWEGYTDPEKLQTVWFEAEHLAYKKVEHCWTSLI